MKTLLAAIALLTTVNMAAAQIRLPLITKLVDKNGQPVGTATLSGRTWVLRDTNGELIGSMTVEPDGSKTIYDADGNNVTPK